MADRLSGGTTRMQDTSGFVCAPDTRPMPGMARGNAREASNGWGHGGNKSETPPFAKAPEGTSSPTHFVRIRASGGLPPEAQRAKGGAGSRDRTGILSLEGSLKAAHPIEIKRPCVTVPRLFTLKSNSDLRSRCHTPARSIALALATL